MYKPQSLKWRLVSSLLLVFFSIWSLVFVWLYIDLQKRLQDTLDQRLSASAQMVARLIQQLPIQNLNHHFLEQTQQHNTDLIACEVSLFSSDVSIGQHVIAKTRGAPEKLSQQKLGLSTWQQGEVQWRSYVLRKGDIQVVAAEKMFLRESLLKQILQSVLIPLMGSLLICIGLIIFIVRREFRALDEIATHLNQPNLSLADASQYLATLEPQTMPTEVKPFVVTSAQLIQKLHQSLEHEKRFTAYAAHELRSPLTAIKTHVQLAQMMAQPLASEKLQYNLQQADASIRRYAELLEQLLTLTAADHALDETISMTKIKTVLDRVIDDLSTDHPHIRQHLVVDLTDVDSMPLPTFALETVFKNLIENALLHAQAEQIYISMHNHVLTIKDNGTRLEPHEIKYLGQRFWRKSAQQKGHGLGLALVQMILKKYGYQLHFAIHPPCGVSVSILPIGLVPDDCIL